MFDLVLVHEDSKLYDEDLRCGDDFAVAAEVSVLFAALTVSAGHIVVQCILDCLVDVGVYV